MRLSIIYNVERKKCLLLLLFVSTLFFLARLRYAYVAETEISLPIRLGEPPSVILAPHSGFCDNYRYLVIVVTRVEEPAARRLFVLTYGRFRRQHNFTFLFPVGWSKDEHINIALYKEHKKYSNILQTNFIDSYHNLTLKSYSYANYIRKNCTNVKAILKVDDDISWNVQQVFNYLEKIDPDGNILYCKTQDKIGVERRKEERWYVARKQYPHKLFPEYCLSPLYAGTPATFAKLCSTTSAVDHVWLDDVFSAGIVAQKAGVSFQQMPINSYIDTYEPFLNGSVLAQSLRRKKDGLGLFVTINL